MTAVQLRLMDPAVGPGDAVTTGIVLPPQAAYAGSALSAITPAAAVPMTAISSLAAQRNFIDSLIALQVDSS